MYGVFYSLALVFKMDLDSLGIVLPPLTERYSLTRFILKSSALRLHVSWVVSI